MPLKSEEFTCISYPGSAIVQCVSSHYACVQYANSVTWYVLHSTKYKTIRIRRICGVPKIMLQLRSGPLGWVKLDSLNILMQWMEYMMWYVR